MAKLKSLRQNSTSPWMMRISSRIVVLYYLSLCVLCFRYGCAEEQEYRSQHLPENEKVCRGTRMGFSQQLNTVATIMQRRQQFINCTYLVGNLEIVFLDTPNVVYDLSFLSTIREVTGYVLIAGNSLQTIPLHNLRIIRGNNPFIYKDRVDTPYALFISLNIRLKELRFNKLTEILNGAVYFQDNANLCFEDTVNWADINPNEKPPVRVLYTNKLPRRTCPECHDSCYSPTTNQRHCWGEGPDMCQMLTHVGCHENCGDGRCYGTAPNQCCHPECAGGCTGPRTTDCFACKHMHNDNGCVPHCPSATKYDSSSMTWVKNPNAKYGFGSMCVKECPQYMLRDAGFCVNSCSENKYAHDGRNCEKCQGPCPLNCKGNGPAEFLDSINLHTFSDCTTITGDLRIYVSTFKGDPHTNATALVPANLTVLKSVREITGSLKVQAMTDELTDLSFLSNLETIHGRMSAPHSKDALHIMGTKLKSLGLNSLKHIRNGNVFIVQNEDLCYVHGINWTLLMSRKEQTADVRFNEYQHICEQEKEVCDPQCGTSGCWGKGPEKCIKCANDEYEEKSLCLNRCRDVPLLFHKGKGKCAKCHEECASSCLGPNDTDCDKCAHVIMRSKSGVDSCVKECGDSMYPNAENVCTQCHPFCAQHGCTGQNRTIGQGGCKGCEIGIEHERFVEGEPVISCMDPGTVNCPSGHYMSFLSLSRSQEMHLFGADKLPLVQRLCVKCHELCLNCTGSNTEFCSDCRYFRSGKHCVRSCPNLNYVNPLNKQCEECDHECRGGCNGPTTFNCSACANFKIYYDENDPSLYNCTQSCPKDLPHLVKDKDDDENHIVCADSSHPEVQAKMEKDKSEDKRKLVIILCSTIPSLLFLLALVACIGFFCFRRAQDNKKAAEYTAKMTGYEEMEPLTPSTAKPDLAKMRLINESELRRGNIIGSGAFGTVYKGIWIPQGENVKIPVAIKVLSEETSPGQSTELLNEARVMCSVEHICCVRILAVCMSSQMMLITQLMPHGCLLEYVRANKSHIGSKVLLDWCTQIARGMAYLEERSVVHRDLAARNVLVQTPNQVKITDFGLAKLLDYEMEEYHATGGLMPIKWLALECIQHRIFTHKSDVWSYGVTAWELFTYGKKPYDGIRTRDVPMMLEKGERLQQPMICTIDVYMIMVKCWMLESDSRPSFKELAEEFAKMSRDPGRYLVIEGDSHMRLRSVDFKKEELVRGMSECPGDIMDAEEYLQPAEPLEYSNQQGSMSATPPYPPVFDRQTSRSPTSPTPLIPISEQTSFISSGEKQGPKVRERKYGHLQSAARAKQERQQPRSRGDSVSSRYTSDPIKFSKEKGEVEWSPRSDHGEETPRSHHPMRSHSHGGLGGGAYGKPIPIHLPLDEDNYLQPQAACAYMDLSSKGYYQNEKAFGSTQAEPVLAELERSESRMSDRSRKESARSRLGSNQSKSGSTSSQTSPLYPGNDNHHSHSSLHHSPAYRINHNKMGNKASLTGASAASVANPEYFDGLADMDYEEDDVWEPKGSQWNGYNNGYQPVPNGPVSPLHSPINSKENGSTPYYNDLVDSNRLVLTGVNGSVPTSVPNGNHMNTLPMVNTRATINNGRHASESLV